MISFIDNVVESFPAAHGNVRFSMVPKDCRPTRGFNLERYMPYGQMYTGLQYYPARNPYRSQTADNIDYVRKYSFQPVYGANPVGRNIGVFVIDDSTGGQELDLVAGQAQKLQQDTAAEVYVIGVGRHCDKGIMRTMASAPRRTHILRAHSYRDLPRVKDTLVNCICENL